MSYKYFIAENTPVFKEHIRQNGLDIGRCRFVHDKYQLTGLRDIIVTVIGKGNKVLEQKIVAHYSHHNVKLEYINGNT